jgi:hypothetical protein
LGGGKNLKFLADGEHNTVTDENLRRGSEEKDVYK